MTELGFRCPQCGTPLGYQGLCWKCQSERTRQEVLAWSSDHIRDVQASVLKGIKKVEEWEDPEYTNFLNLLSYHDALKFKEKLYWKRFTDPMRFTTRLLLTLETNSSRSY